MMIQACAVVGPRSERKPIHTCSFVSSVAAQLLGTGFVSYYDQAYTVVGGGTKSVASRGLA
jgi:hypothetical protein